MAAAVVTGLGSAAAGVTPATAATGPDLTVPSVAAPPSSVMAGESIRVSAKIANTGNRSAAKTTTRFYLSTDAKKSKGDRLITSKATTSLRAKRSTTVTTTAKLSSAIPARTYRLIVCADATSKVRETRETNNCRTATRAVKVTPARADLVISSFSSPPAKVTRGTAMKVTAKVANTGTKTAGASTTRFHLSTDAKFSTNDRVLTSRSTPSLAAGKSATVTSSPTVPNATPPGSYHLIACADATKKVTERSEVNNCRTATRRVTIETPDTTPGGQFLKTPNPLNVTYATEEVTQHLDFDFPDGAIVYIHTVTGSDGTTYELRVPHNATITPVEITMRRVTAITGSPFTSGLGAVEIRPHGLQLIEPATLTITPKNGASGTPTAFKYAEGGYDFHPYPSKLNAKSVTMQLMSFSTVGAANATAAQIDTARTRYTEQARGQLESAAATGDTSDLKSTLEGYTKDVVDPLVEQGMKSDDAAREAISELTNLERTAQLLGFKEGEIVPDLAKKISDLIAAAMARADHNCRNDHRLDRAVDMIALARTAALLGDQDLADFALEAFSACLRWRVDYSARYEDQEVWSDFPPHYYDQNRQVDLPASSRDLYIDLSDTLLPAGYVNGFGRLVWGEARFVQTGVSDDNTPFYYHEYLTNLSDGDIGARLVLDLNDYAPPPSKLAAPERAADTQQLQIGVPEVHSGWLWDRQLTPLLGKTKRSNLNGPLPDGAAGELTKRWSGMNTTAHTRYADNPEFGGNVLTIKFSPADQQGAEMVSRRWEDSFATCNTQGASCWVKAKTEVTLTHAPK